jgi:hypothetical protein
MTSAKHAKTAHMKDEEQFEIWVFVFSSEGNKPIKIHHCMQLHNHKACLSLQQRYDWSRKFKIGVYTVVYVTQLGQAKRLIIP